VKKPEEPVEDEESDYSYEDESYFEDEVSF
jgi:hypothetical protein